MRQIIQLCALLLGHDMAKGDRELEAIAKSGRPVGRNFTPNQRNQYHGEPNATEVSRSELPHAPKLLEDVSS